MKKHRKIQKKQETELYVQVAEKPENQKENVGEALACFCIYVGWYLMVMQFCRASLAMTLSGSVGAILLVMAVLVNGQKEKKFIRKIVHEILAAAVLCFLISFTIRKGWIFQGALIAGNGLLETIGRNMRTFEPDYALTISEPLQPFVTAVFYVTAGMVLAALLEFLRVSKSCIGTILVSLIPGVLLLIWQKEAVLFPVLLIYVGFLCLVAFRKKEKGLAQLQTDVMLLVLFAAVAAAGFFMLRGKASSFSPDNPFSQKVQKFAEQIRYGKKTVDSLPEGQFRGLGNLKLTDEAALKVTMEHPDSLYLRGFVGSIYTEDGWKQQDADEIYDELINYIVDALKSEEDFDKILYEYMIKNGNLSGKKVCLLLYDQGVLDKKKDKDYNSLYTGKMSAYNFMYKKIKNIEITPAQLALDPCSGSVVITDPDTGEVKEMVSYPSYNNNRLANGIDSSYYASLNTDLSSPMLNRATQSRTAPGSTFKPISSTAVLEEGVANASTYVKCTGIFDKISPAAKCWIYPNAHGSLNVSGAIAVSCNFFFYQMGYNLGTVNGTYNSQRGLTKLKKYASMYGFNRKSGVEITEYEPHISDEDAIRSAIGQGTHSYTPSQISRYVTSLVNHKNLIDLSLIEKTTDSSGSVITSYKKRTEEKLDIKSSTFDLIKKGMIGVVNGKDSSIKYMYEKQGMKVAGKTGTAQENKKRPNHALFISYAPYDNPDITMTVVVPNGYTSANAAEIARDIYKYYFGKASKAEKKATTALLPTGSDGSND